MATKRVVLAIDFGTTSTVAATLSDEGPAQVLELDGARSMPSIVFVDDDGQLLVGRAAEALAPGSPQRALRSPKRRLGDAAPVVIGGRAIATTTMVGALLRYVMAQAEDAGIRPTEVRLTYPATWGRPQLARLTEAASLAGIAAPKFVPEPVAAALAHTTSRRFDDGALIAVHDLGGGTFDTALLRAEPPIAAGMPTTFSIVGRPTGDQHLGGELFDELIAQWLTEGLTSGDAEQLAVSEDRAWRRAAFALLTEARRVKEALSLHPYADVVVALPTGLVERRMTRGDLSSVIDPYLRESIDRLTYLVEDSGSTWTDLSAVLLLGGASRTPRVTELLAERLPGVEIVRRGDPKTAVAIGATHRDAPGIAYSGSPRPGSTDFPGGETHGQAAAALDQSLGERFDASSVSDAWSIAEAVPRPPVQVEAVVASEAPAESKEQAPWPALGSWPPPGGEARPVTSDSMGSFPSLPTITFQPVVFPNPRYPAPPIAVSRSRRRLPATIAALAAITGAVVVAATLVWRSDDSAPDQGRDTAVAGVTVTRGSSIEGPPDRSTTPVVPATTSANGTSALGSSGATIAASRETTPDVTGSLRGVCPETVVIQSDQPPGPWDGYLYGLMGQGSARGSTTNSIAGPLMDGALDTGVRLEIRVWDQLGRDPSPLLTADTSVYLAVISTDDAVRNSQFFKSTAVFAPFARGDGVVLWRAESFPDVTKVSELPKGVPVLDGSGGAGATYLRDTGVLPSVIFEAGFAPTTETLAGKSAALGLVQDATEIVGARFQLLADLGWDPYPRTLAVKAGTVEDKSACLTALVPILQRSQRDAVLGSGRIASDVAKLAPGVGDMSVNHAWLSLQRKHGLIADALSGLGSMELERIGAFVVRAKKTLEVSGNVVASELATNEFVDQSVVLG